MFRLLYTILTTIASLALFPLFLLRPRGRSRLLERYGIWNLNLADCVWFHGASMGEVNGLLPLIRTLRTRYPDLPILVTATSVTGLQQAENEADYIRLVPFDSDLWLWMALRKINPRAFIFGETELWPALLGALHKKNIPTFLVNARISDKAFIRYQRMSSLVAPLLQNITHIAVQSAQAKERFLALGANASSISVTGNAKYDVQPSLQSEEERRKLHTELFTSEAPVLVLGSLRPGEEEIWFPVLASLLMQQKNINVIIAPRHTEKFEFFAERLEAYKIPFVRRTQAIRSQSVILLDTLGELRKVYALADVAFVGGTLRNFGGHNPLEPAMYGACVVVGPYSQNAADVVALLRENEAIIEIVSATDAANVLDKLINHDMALTQCGKQAQAVWLSMNGAVEKTLSIVQLKEQNAA